MKVALSHLREFLDFHLSTEELCHTLTLAGLEIEDATVLENGDTLLDIALTPNLGHCMSVRGIARELAAQLNLPLKKRARDCIEKGPDIAEVISAQVIDKRQCPHYLLRALLGVKVGPSPEWLQKKLEQSGIRSINNAVDVGNLVMLECGQPLHIFDLDQIQGSKLTITSQTDFKEIVTLDEVLRPLPPESVLICDGEKPLAIGGVMGALSCGVTEKTQNLLIEAAVFTPESIRKTCKILGLKSDSSQRFEKGIDPNGLAEALDRAASLLAELTHGKICRGILDHSARVVEKKKITCRVERANQLLGTKLSSSEIAEIFKRLEMEVVEESSHALTLLIPTYRNDLHIEVDLIEEIARVFGYNNLPQHPPKVTLSTLPDAPIYLFEKEMRKRLIAQGLQEMITCDLIHPDQAKLSLENAMGEGALISVLQPSSVDQSVLRTSLLPGLLQVVQHNSARGTTTIAAFEIGRVHFKEKETYQEPSVAAIVLSGHATPYHIDPKPRKVDFFDLKGHVENLFEGLGITGIYFETAHLHNFHPKRQALIRCEGATLGVMGEVHPERLMQLGIEQKLYYAEVNLHELLPLLPKARRVAELPLFPGSERDWTLTVDDALPLASLLDAVRKHATPLLEDVALLDLYKSEQIGKDRKNVTLRFFYRDRQKTIAYETVEREHAEIMQAVVQHLNLISR